MDLKNEFIKLCRKEGVLVRLTPEGDFKDAGVHVLFKNFINYNKVRVTFYVNLYAMSGPTKLDRGALA